MTDNGSCPNWVSDNPSIQRLLSRLLGRHSKGITQAISVKTILPALYDFGGDPNYLWQLVCELETKHKIINIKLLPSTGGAEVYQRATLKFNPDREMLVRAWLDQPRVSATVAAWQAAINTEAQQLGEAAQILLPLKPITRPDIEADEIIRGFSLMKQRLRQPIALRTLSAKCFWGDSKFLDEREPLIESLYPTLKHNLISRKLLINVCLPSNETLKTVIFVENKDSYLELCVISSKFNNTAFVYSAGFMASDKRIRQSSRVIFSYTGANWPACQNTFEANWLDSTTDTTQHYYWGDLDYSGMGILKALKKVFPNIDAWKPGYVPMLAIFDEGNRHRAESTDKQGQIEIISTGCHYADTVLIPLLRQTQCYLDQEVIAVEQLVF